MHTIEILTAAGKIVQKSFDSNSLGVDLVHRIEKLSHELPGSNIIMTESFVNSLSSNVFSLKEVGVFSLKGQKESCKLFLKPSEKVTEEMLRQFSNLALLEKKKLLSDLS